MKKIIIITSVLVLLLISVCTFKPHYFDKIITPLKKNIECLDFEEKIYSSKLKDGLSSYINAARRNGISKCSDKNEILNNKGLKKIKNTDFFVIDNLTHSYPYLTEDGEKLLNDIGERFNSKIANSDLENTKFIVTSLTRTTESIKRLRKTNGNSVSASPHLYGECFDIRHDRFSNYYVKLKPCHIKYLKETLAGVIYELKKKNKCWALTEEMQPCFHIVYR